MENLKKLRKEHFKKLIIAQLNINSIRNKFDALVEISKGNIDILMISETKLDKSFPEGQFYIDGYSKPIRIDRNSRGGGIILFVREDIPINVISIEDLPIECFFVELKLHKKNWLLCCSYNPNKSLIDKHLDAIKTSLDLHISKYENILLLGDFNAEITESSMKEFCEIYNLKNLIKTPTCYKNLNHPSCIDLCLTNCPSSFCSSCVVETGLSDFHKMTLIVTKTHFERLKPRILKYRDYKNYSQENFRNDLIARLSIETFDNDNPSKFLNICNEVIKRHAPLKQKSIRGNQAPFMNKELSRANMKRSMLRNKFLREKSEENRVAYCKQRNYCVSLLRKTKKSYYGNLDEKKVCDNRQFWKTIKPLFSEKVSKSEKIILTENDEVISDNTNVAETLNCFFADIVKNLEIPKYKVTELNNGITDPVLKAIEKYKDHPSIISIKKRCKGNSSFSFENLDRNYLHNEISKLNANKSCQENDIPTKIIKENSDIFSDFLISPLNNSIEKGEFPDILKLADITPVFKKDQRI